MRHIIIILLFICSVFIVNGQSNPSGFPTQLSTGWFRHGWDQSDSGKIFTNRAPNFTPRFPGTVEFYQDAGIDSLLHLWTGARWLKLIPGFDSTSLSNRINLKLNISDTANMLLPYLRAADTSNKWVNEIRRLPGSVNVEIFKNGSWSAAYTDSVGAGGSGLTSVGLSLPSAFTVTNSPLTSNGTLNVIGAGTTLQYVRGNGTLATTDTGMIPNFYLKVRGLFSATSPLTYNSTTGIFGVGDANTAGTKGVATFSSSSFSDNGLGTISLADVTTAGPCINCDITFDAKGRAISFASGTPPQFVNAPGAGDTLSVSDTLKRLNPGFGILHAVTANNITQRIDTSAIATQYDLTLVNNGLSKNGDTTQFGQTVSAAGNPAALHHNTEIPLNGFNTVFTGTGSIGMGTGGPSSSIKLTVVASGSNGGMSVSTGSGTAINATTSGNAIVGQSTGSSFTGVMGSTGSGGYGVQGSGGIGGIGGKFYATAAGGDASPVALELERQPTGAGVTNGAGFTIMFRNAFTNGTTGNESGRITNYFSNAVSGSQSSEFGFHLVNNTVSARKALLAATGQWTWDGYPELTAQVDSATYKPVAIDGSGNVVKMAGWTSTATTPSWQQTLDVSHNSFGRLLFDTSYTKPTGVENPATHTWFTMNPLVKADDTVTSPFYWNQFAGLNNGEVNEVMMFGWNLSAGGGAVQVGKPALGESWESNYRIIEVPDFNRLMEKHEYYVNPAGLQYRLGSYTINTNAGTCNYYHSVDNFNLRTFAPAGTNTPYFSVQGGTEMTLINPSNEFDYFKFACNYAQDINTSSLTISNSTVKPITNFNLSNFTSASFPNISITGKGYGGSQIDFGGETTGALGTLLFDSSQTKLTTATNVPINFTIDGLNVATIKKTKMGTAVPLAVNSGTFSSTPFAALESSANSASLEAAGWFQQSSTAASSKYGIEVYANGSSGINEGIYVSATNANINRSIRIQFPSAGANNYAIYSDATAQSYFAGNIGLNTGAPLWGLDVQRSMGANKDSITLVSAIGSNSLLIQDTTNGKFQRISAAAFATGNTLYTGDGTLSGNRTVTGSSNSLTFNSINTFTVNAIMQVLAKNDGTKPFTGAILSSANYFDFAYTPVAGIYSKGAGIVIDSNNNVGIGTVPSTTNPLYTTGNSAFLNGMVSQAGNFYRVDQITSNQTIGLTQNFFNIDATSGNITLTLPAASSAFGGSFGLDYIFKRVDNSGNTVTIQRAGSDTIDGATSFTLTTQWESKSLRATSSSTWNIY